MELNEIKKIIQEEKTKIIVTAEGEVALVIMSYEDYKKMKGEKREEKKAEFSPAPSKVPAELESESLKIDDLPF